MGGKTILTELLPLNVPYHLKSFGKKCTDICYRGQYFIWIVDDEMECQALYSDTFM